MYLSIQRQRILIIITVNMPELAKVFLCSPWPRSAASMFLLLCPHQWLSDCQKIISRLSTDLLAGGSSLVEKKTVLRINSAELLQLLSPKIHNSPKECSLQKNKNQEKSRQWLPAARLHRTPRWEQSSRHRWCFGGLIIKCLHADVSWGRNDSCTSN